MKSVYLSASIYTTLAGVEVHFEDLNTEFEPTPNQLLEKIDSFLEDVSFSIADAMEEEANKNNIADVTVELDINGFDVHPLPFVVENPMKNPMQSGLFTVAGLKKEFQVAAEEFSISELRPKVLLFVVSSKEFEEQ